MHDGSQQLGGLVTACFAIVAGDGLGKDVGCSVRRVLNDTCLFVALRDCATSCSNAGSDPVVTPGDVSSTEGRFLFGFSSHDDLIALSDGDKYRVGLVGYDWHQISRNHLKVVIVNGKDKHGFRGCIDELEEISFAFLECLVVLGAFEDGFHAVHSLETARIRRTAVFGILTLGNIACGRVACITTFGIERRALELVDAAQKQTVAHGNCLGQFLLERNGAVLVHPVLHHDGSKCLVPVVAARPIDGQRSSNAIGVLRLVMAMVPCMAILLSMEAVCVRLTVCDRTLCHTVHTIVLIGVQLSNTVPMNGRSEVGNLVSNVHDKGVSPAPL